MYDIENVKNILSRMSAKMNLDSDMFGELDSISGDGDLGATAKKLSMTLDSMCEEKEDDIGKFFLTMALRINTNAPSTMGTLLSAGVLTLGKAFKDKKYLSYEDIIKIPQMIANTIREKGNADLNDKTILDAIVPMSLKVIEVYGQSHDLKDSFSQGAKAAAFGADNTKGMKAKAGRAKWTGDQTKDNPDAGAVMCASIVSIFK